MERYRFSLTKKALLAISIVLFPIFVTFIITYQLNSGYLGKLVLNNLTALAEAYEGNIYQFLEMSRRRAHDFSSDGFIRDRLTDIGRGHNPAVASSSLSEHLIKNKIVLDKTIRVIEVASPDGVIVAATSPSEIGENVSGDEFFIKGRVAATVTENLKGHEGLPELALSAPVFSRDRKTVAGVIVNFIRLGDLNAVLAGKYPGGEPAEFQRNRIAKLRTMEVYLVNKDRRMLTESIFIKDAPLRQTVDTLPVGACLDGNKETIGFYKNYLGSEVAGSSTCLPGLKWTLVVEVDRGEALKSLSSMKRGVIIAGIVVTGFIGALLAVFLRTVVRGIRRISSAAKKIASGDYDVTVPVFTGDEVGALAGVFNGMAKKVMDGITELKSSEARLKEAQRMAHLGNWERDMATGKLFWSDEMYRILGLSPLEFGATYEAFLRFVHPDDREALDNAVRGALSSGTSYGIDYRVILPGGTERVVHESDDVIFDSSGAPARIIGTLQDVTERKRAEQELKKLVAVIEQSTNVVLVTDTEGAIEYVNSTFERTTGYSREEAVGKTPRIMSSGETPRAAYDELWREIKAGKTWRGVLKDRKKNGEFYWASNIISPVMDEKGRIIRFLCIQEDITERVKAEERIQQLASRDVLTGLLNRARFMDLMGEWLGYARTRDQRGALILVDVDQFKLINDTYGHGFGDELVRQMARLIDVTLTHADIPGLKEATGQMLVGRMGGDEFAVFIPSATGDIAVAVCEHVRKTVGHYGFMDSSVKVTVSMGIALFPDDGVDVKELFTKVDAAMFHAKEKGRDRCHLYSEEDHLIEDMHLRMKWKAKILKALEEDRFEAWLQPIMDIKTGEAHCYEALARMRDEDGTIIMPGAFIETAERFGLVNLIDRAIAEKVMMLQARLSREGRHLSFCVNLSGKSLADAELLRFLDKKTVETGAAASSIVFEITETAAVENLDVAKKFIEGGKALGYRFSLDDFGVGFTSFLYLRELDVDHIKIDGSFVRKLSENENDRLFVKAIVDVAKGMKILTVAEFVENEGSLEVLKTIGVDYAQGYLIGKPAATLPPG
ncbi:MAG: EAL domain-containing protein [Deltaproteobacteria bacterium]|nr:EAL domain-containing protein [Deltaproteobacteria bacterium]